MSPIPVGSRADQPVTRQPNSIGIGCNRSVAGSNCRRCAPRLVPCAPGHEAGSHLRLEENECLLNEGGMVLENAAVPGVGENAQLRFRQPTRELE